MKILTIAALILLPYVITAQTSLAGIVMDSILHGPIQFGTVALIQNDKLIRGVETDLEGKYYFNDIKPGIYDVEATYVGYTPSRLNDVFIKMNQDNIQDIYMSEGVLADEIITTSCGFMYRLIEFDNMESGATITSEDIRKMPIPK